MDEILTKKSGCALEPGRGAKNIRPSLPFSHGFHSHDMHDADFFADFVMLWLCQSLDKRAPDGSTTSGKTKER
ncbi:hypothetical protein RvY_10179 [Ramazzottius varieornatus]|uniref:Uncharacterized protein n=1 Tax=Ramazzottius varieornatus TaxID=947166 RepID=A0A1D1VH93_RAMVA|nr:hypothetical protein RvY_10179 [Ramazzottius varieornatus]